MTGRHAVGLLLRGLFAAHDRRRVEVLGYSLRRHDDPVAAALAAEFDVFHDLQGVPAETVARRIREDAVDVLVDLGGYTAGARPEVLALRPAPVQLGFIDGHEAPRLDGLLLDWHVQPEDAPGRGRTGCCACPACCSHAARCLPAPRTGRASAANAGRSRIAQEWCSGFFGV